MKLQLIVLNSVKFRDNALIVNGYSNIHGRNGFVVYGLNKARRHLLVSHLHPLSIIDAELNEQGRGTLPVLKEFTSSFNLVNIRTGIVKNAISAFMGELIYKTLRESGPDMNLYGFLISTILKLENETGSVSDFHPCFIVDYCKQLGYLPGRRIQEINALFNIPTASFTPFSSAGIYSFSRESSEILARILNNDSGVYLKLNINGASRYNFISEMLKYLSYHQGFETELRSLKVLHEIFE